MSLVRALQAYPLQTKIIDDVVYGYREAGGNSNHLVLLHGISSGSGSWIYQFENLSHDFHIIAWDAPGYGSSSNLNISQPNSLNYADSLKILLNNLGINEVVLVGHSLGAMQASAFACKYPHMVKKLVLANLAQGYGSKDSETKDIIYHKRPSMLKELGVVELAKQRSAHLLHNQYSDVLEFVQRIMLGLNLEGITKSSYLLAYDDIRKYLTYLDVPCYLIVGAKDQITPKEGIIELSKKINFANLHVINNAGHLSYLDQPELFNSIIRLICNDFI